MLRVVALFGLCGCDILFQLQTVPAVDARADAPADAPIAGLVAYYPMDDVGQSLSACLKEASGGPSGTCYGAVPPQGAGVLGGAYMFDGTDSVRLADNPVFDTPSFTVAAWEQLTVQPGGSYDCPLNRIQGPFADDTWQFCLLDGGAYANFAGYSTMFAVTNLVGAWHHAAFTFDSSTHQFVFWFDGANMFSGTAAPMIDPVEPISLGMDLSSGSPDAPFTGLLDELRFYDHALTAGEITMLATP
jgi:hypothetical protein